jgi:hypothetical protein
MKSKGNHNKPVLKVVTTKTLQPPKRYHSADVCLAAVTRPRHNSFGTSLERAILREKTSDLDVSARAPSDHNFFFRFAVRFARF